MKLQVLKPSAAAKIGLLLTVPALYFIFIAVLKYLFDAPTLFDASEPFLTSLGANKPLGWNINLLIVFGPLLTFLFNLSAIATIYAKWEETSFSFHISLQRKLWNWVAIFLSSGCLIVLFLYALGENCRC